MHCKKKAAIYPFNSEFMPVIRHKDLIVDYEIVSLISPPGWGLVGKDAGLSDKGEKSDIIVESDFNSAIENCDTIIFADCSFDKKMYANIIDKMHVAINWKKNIVCTLKLDNTDKEKLELECRHENIYFKYYGKTNDSGFIYNTDDNIMESIEEIQTPIVFVTGIAERCCKFETQLSIREKMLQSGYSISHIGSRHYCELMGFHSFPSFMYEYGIPDSKRVAMFNKYIRYIEEQEKPDIIVIGIPGGIIPLNHILTCGFGLLAYQVSLAIIPDFVIFCLFYENYPLDYFNEINTITKYKMGYDIDCFNLSNVQFGWSNAKMFYKKDYCMLESDFISKKILELQYKERPIYNILNKSDRQNIFSYMESVLSRYGEREILSIGGV